MTDTFIIAFEWGAGLTAGFIAVVLPLAVAAFAIDGIAYTREENSRRAELEAGSIDG